MDLILTKTVKSNLRIGLIKLNSNSSDVLTNSSDERGFSLPLCLQYTKDGFIPHLTWDLVKYIPDNNVPTLVSLASAYNLLPVLGPCGLSISDLLSSDFNRAIFLTIQDVLVARRKGYNSSTSVPIWTESGRHNIYPIDLIECVKAFKPDLYQLLCDGETPKDTSNKRNDKSVQNTLQLAQDSFAIKEFDWKSAPIFGVIEGGWDIQRRLLSIEKTKALPVDGFVIDGLLSDDLLDDSSENKLRLQSLISEICSNLPSDKPRALFGPLKPELVIELISAGIDIIDSSYCSYLTNSETVLLVDIQSDLNVTSNLLKLSEENLKEDFTVIDCHCKCYTCTKGFTRAYLNHLTNTKELLGPVLINLHNLFVYYNFISQIHSHFNFLQQSDQKKSES